jgi:hypothetical protein
MSKTQIFIDSQRGSKQFELKIVDLNKIKLDPTNVRFIHLAKIMTDKEIENYIWSEPDTKVLYKQIVSSGGLSDIPFLTTDFVVREGNRRIVCLRKAKEALAAGEIVENIPANSFDKIQVNIFEKAVSQEEIDIMLARWHVTGKKEWDALNQANHIWKMYNNRGISYDRICDLIGISKGQVIQKCKAYEYTVEYMNSSKDSDIKKFSFFEELYKKKDLRNWILSTDNKENFFKWVKEGKFNVTGARDVRKLPEIMNDKDAFNALTGKNGTIEKAILELQLKNPALSSGTFRAVENAIYALQALPRSEYEAIPKKPNEVKMLLNLHKELVSIFNNLKIKIS